MTTDEHRRRNIDLAFAVVYAALADPEAAAEVATYAAEGAFVLADPNDAELSLANEEMAEVLRARGQAAVLLEVQTKVTHLQH